MTTPLVQKMMALFDDPTEYHWFDASGGFKDHDSIGQEPLLNYKPPFEKCMVAWQGIGRSGLMMEMLMLVAGTDPEEGILLSVWRIPARSKAVKSPVVVYLIDDGLVRYGATDDADPIADSEAAMILGFCSAWLGSMSRKCDVYIPSVRQTFTNKRKIEAGKRPTYDWRTIVIEPAKPKAQHQGGTHASPRSHDRRGHLRRLRNGGQVWVRDCRVGDASKGAVFHDYEVAA